MVARGRGPSGPKTSESDRGHEDVYMSKPLDTGYAYLRKMLILAKMKYENSTRGTSRR